MFLMLCQRLNPSSISRLSLSWPNYPEAGVDFTIRWSGGTPPVRAQLPIFISPIPFGATDHWIYRSIYSTPWTRRRLPTSGLGVGPLYRLHGMGEDILTSSRTQHVYRNFAVPVGTGVRFQVSSPDLTPTRFTSFF